MARESEIWTGIYTALPRKSYYSSEVSKICVASVSVEMRGLQADGAIKLCECELPVSPLSRRIHGSTSKICRRWRQLLPKRRFNCIPKRDGSCAYIYIYICMLAEISAHTARLAKALGNKIIYVHAASCR